ncbi:MAG: T9SS type A sorting domain-containing protein, partial [Saprospiraceae bacterium]|nr:T9SS type A sorting domain-containing protein [Saprospiraceae bacterium]
KTIPISLTTWRLNVNDLGQLFVIDPANFTNRVLSSADGGDSWYYLPVFPQGTESLGAGIISADGHLYYQRNDGALLRSKNPTQFGAYVRGEVAKDADMDCSTPDAQQPLKNWIIALEGENTYYAITNDLGRYTIFADTGNYTVKAQIPQTLWWALCDTSQVIEANELMNADTVNFVALPLLDCPILSVNVAIPQLRRCFDNTAYVQFCNQGTETADSAWVDVILDPFLTFVSSTQPQELLGNNTVRFFVGDVASGDCGQFQLTVYVNCDSTVLGQTHCIVAHGFPDTLCTTLPDWSGANIEASVTCQDSILQFNLKNTGTATSKILEYIIIEDDIVLLTGQEDYNVAEDLILDVPANGKTWRIESEQEPGHPFSFLVLAFAEGCGGFESLGYINQFPVIGSSPSWHQLCVENIGAYDPNDKQGFPIGVGNDHNIRPGQTIDYLVRFQNTGTDTAFTVVIRDTLSVFLDPTTVRPGASSHAYTWSLSGQGVINFTFNNIMLPDSNVNEPASNGFVQFSITPYLDVPLGSVIENDAAIYFDFNEPVITNTTWHTIQKSPLTSALWSEPQKTAPSLLVWPNPFNERISVRLNQKTSGTLLLKIYDSRGTLVAQKATNGPEIELNTRQLPAGLYWAEVRDAQGRLLGNGKLVKE